MPYIGKSPEMGVRTRYYYTVSAGATSVSGSDDNSKSLVFSDGEFVDVSLNGVALVAGTDYNTTTANTIAGLSAMSANDVVEVIVYDVFSVFSGDISGDLAVGGNLTGANGGALTVGVATTVSSNLAVTGTSTLTGNVGIGTSSVDVSTQAGGSGYKAVQIESDEGGQLNFDHNDAGTGSTLGQLNFQRAGEVVAEIEGVTSGATDSGHIGFRTQATGGALTERFRFGSAGQIGIAGANYGTSGQVLTSGGASSATTWADAGGGATALVGSTTMTNATTSSITLDNIFSTTYDHYKVIGSSFYINGASSDTVNMQVVDSSGALTGSSQYGQFIQASYGANSYSSDHTSTVLATWTNYAVNANNPAANFVMDISLNRTSGSGVAKLQMGGKIFIDWYLYMDIAGVLRHEYTGTPTGLKFFTANENFENGLSIRVYGFSKS